MSLAALASAFCRHHMSGKDLRQRFNLPFQAEEERTTLLAYLLLRDLSDEGPPAGPIAEYLPSEPGRLF